MRRWLLALLTVVVLATAAFVMSPWPSVLLIRAIFDKGAADAAAGLQPYVPAGIRTVTLRYDPADDKALLDILRPVRPRPGAATIVWIHGGGFVSGRREDVSNYLKILAGKGFVIVNVDYTIAPEATYPGPVRQVNVALAFLTREGPRLGIDPNRLVLAGDSAGAQIAAQTAALVTNPEYARVVGVSPGASPAQIRGTLLYCGIYDVTRLGGSGGVLAWFVKSTTWAYSGKRDWRQARGFETISVAPHVTSRFPSTFISAGNADPLAPQSKAFAEYLREQGVAVDSLFFPENLEPGLGHEYQFDLDSAPGRLALARSVRWLATL